MRNEPQDNEVAASLVTLALGVCSAVANRGRQSMERNPPARRAALQQSAVDNSLSTYIPEGAKEKARTGALSALKASFGVKDANSPTRARQQEQVTPTAQQQHTPTSTSSPKHPPSQRRAFSFGLPQQSPVETATTSSTDNWEHGKLYEAYNELHALAQAFQKPFDAPAILVVGHQTDGKSGEP